MVLYRIDATDVHAHCYRVTLTIPEPASEQRLSLPVWVPGSYLVREFARHLSSLAACQGALEVPLEQLDKATWLARTQGPAALTVTYSVYAFDTSVRAAFLDARRGFINGTSLFLRVEGQEDRAHGIDLAAMPAGWQVATTLRPVQTDADGLGTYRAADYDELVDHPLELGRFWRAAFTARGVPHAFVVAGALPDFDGARLLADAARICDMQIAFWHAAGERNGAAAATPVASTRPPFERYLFLLNAVEDGHGGLEHRASTALIAPRRDLPRRDASGADRAGAANAALAQTAGNGKAVAPNTEGKAGADSVDPGDGYANVLGLISHEYFHSWNVKRMRPREFARYDYARENYTRLLWFFEGFTSYYDDLLLRRAGLIDASRYLKLLARTVSNVAATPGRFAQSAAEASFDAWVKFYRSDENTPNATISYYAKGSLIALALDLTLRAEGRGTLDDVMRALWTRSAGGPMDEADIAAALEAVGGRSFAGELAAWVHGKGELPLQRLLEATGVEWRAVAPTLAQSLGLRVSESALTGIKVTHALRGGAAEAAGLASGDEVLAVNGWRLRRLDEATRLIEPGQAGEFLVVRDQRLQTLSVVLPVSATPAADTRAAETPVAIAPAAGAIALAPAAKPAPAALARYKAWLAG